MRTELLNIVTYFSLYEGGEKNDWPKIKAFAEKFAHADLTLHSAKGTMNKEQWMTFLETFATGGGRVDPLSFVVEDEGNCNTTSMTIRYRVRLHYPDGTVSTLESLGTFRDRRLYHVEPFDPTKYNKFVEMSGMEGGSDAVAVGQ